MLSFTLTILEIGIQECWDKATLSNPMITGAVYLLLIPPAK
jgi:hypothetical protein